MSYPKRIAIIDSDAATANVTKQQVQKINVTDVDVFLDAEIGFQSIREGSYTGAVIDWRQSGQTSGLAILCRLRRIPKFVYLPIIISASSVQREDFRIIQDFQCTAVMQKPLRDRFLLEDLTKLQAEFSWYISNETKIVSALNAASLDGALAMGAIEHILDSAPNSIPFALLAARYLVKHNYQNLAFDLYERILAEDPFCLAALSGKAKLYTKMGRHQAAIQTLQEAQKISPQNIDRMAILGEIEISLNNPQGAIDHFKKALAIDNKFSKAQIGLAVAQNFSKLVSMQTSIAGDEMSVAKIVNNLGVSLVRQGQYEKAIRYYLMSLAFLGGMDLQASVSFNLGLGFKRWSKLPQAKFWLEKSLKLANGKNEKASRQLIGMEKIIPAAGLSLLPETSASPKRPRSTGSLQLDLPETASESDKDLSFLEEEVVTGSAKATGPVGDSAAQAFDSMIDSIDKIIEISGDFKFEDEI